MNATLDWLAERDAGVPAVLRERVRETLERGAPSGVVPNDLLGAALLHLRSALRAGKNRNAATDLLAADALLTWACEAAGEAGCLTELADAAVTGLAREAAHVAG